MNNKEKTTNGWNGAAMDAVKIIACKWDRQIVSFVLLLFCFGGGSSWFGTMAIAVAAH